jgi:predicted metal-dependent HD superfamily phosphohydrolase
MDSGRPSISIIALEQKAFVTVQEMFESTDSVELTYHNWSHTEKVYRDALLLCNALQISPEQTSAIGISALFHDLGHFQCDAGHEAVGAQMAVDFLSHNQSHAYIKEISENILTTAMGVSPTTIGQQILKDADLLYIAEPHFLEIAELLRQEWAIRRGIAFNEHDWLLSNLHFLSAHEFYTPYAYDKYNAQKQRNIEHIKHLLA